MAFHYSDSKFTLISPAACKRRHEHYGFRKQEGSLMIKTFSLSTSGHLVNIRQTISSHLKIFPLSDLHHEAAKLDKKQDVVLICRSGIRSRRAAKYLKNKD